MTKELLILSALLFSLGLAIVVVKKHAIVVLMGIELMLSAANINFITFSRHDPHIQGQFFTLFVLIVAASEAAVGLAIIIKLYRYLKTGDLNQAQTLKQ